MRWFILTLAVCASACATQQSAVCKLDMDLKLFPPWTPHPESFDASLWEGLLLRGYDMDCSGRPVVDPNAASQWQALRPVVLHLQPHGDNAEWLVWLETHRSRDGRATGPVALVQVGYERMAVRTLGKLEAPSSAVSLRYIHLGTMNALRIDTGTCSSATDATSDMCRDIVQVLPEEGGQFLDAAGAVDLQRREIVAMPHGNRRVFELSAVLDAGERAFHVHERVVVSEIDPRQPALPPRFLRQSEAVRSLRWDGRAWQSSAPSLWERVRSW